MVPIRAYADAMRVARHYCADQGEQIVANVAEALWRRARNARA